MLLGESSQNGYIDNGGQLKRLFVEGHVGKGVLTNDWTTSIAIAGHGQ